jgi:hypothetical protein
MDVALVRERINRTVRGAQDWLSDGRRAMAAAVVFGVLVAAWMLRYETLPHGIYHKNRLTGAICHIRSSCWFSSD